MHALYSTGTTVYTDSPEFDRLPVGEWYLNELYRGVEGGGPSRGQGNLTRLTAPSATRGGTTRVTHSHVHNVQVL